MENQTSGAWQAWHSEDTPIRLGASSCLLGEEVRYDGGHARNRFVCDVLGTWVEWVPVCPEFEAGMGIPRPTVRVVEDDRGERMVAPSTGKDYTDAVRKVSTERVATLSDIDGYVLKKKSPSCGLERIRVYGTDGQFRRNNGVGFFALELLTRGPLRPVEVVGRLNDSPLRENSIERVFCHNRWRGLVDRGITRKGLVDFHTAHKLIVRSHNEMGYRRLGRIVASLGPRADEEVFAEYEAEFQLALQTKATKKKHTNVLQHALGYLKQLLDANEKQEILTAIEDFRRGLLPVIVPLTLLRFAINSKGVEYLQGQLYFDPHPKELMLRNHV
jgi:uncharacterized protein YbgA (DUF1722 family)/uncharacterized protein YbbK (DUF523 family)